MSNVWNFMKKIIMQWAGERAAFLPRNDRKCDRYVVYPERWFILSSVCLLALSNATQWIAYLSLNRTTDAFFCENSTESEELDHCQIGFWTNQIFQIVGMTTGIFGLYITDKYGIKLSLICGATFNVVGSLVRLGASMPIMPVDSRKYMLHTGSVLAAAAQPFFLVLSPKVAEYWFSENQRALANVLSFIANPVGVAVGSILPTVLIQQSDSSHDSTDMLIINAVFLGLASVVFVMSICTRRSIPPTPSSPSTDQHFEEFRLWEGLKNLFRTPSFVILLFPFGIAFALNWSVFIITDSLLSEIGFEKYAGYMTAVSAVTGGATSILAGAIVDRTKAFKEVIRICFCGIFLVAVSINLFARFASGPDVGWTVLMCFLFSLLGGFSIPIFPIAIEVGVETTFPIPEATSSGVLVIVAQAFMFTVTYLMDKMRNNIDFYFYKHGLKSNYFLALDFWCLLGLIGFLISVFALKPHYKRLEFEQRFSKEHADIEEPCTNRTTVHDEMFTAVDGIKLTSQT